ncbi:major capsid protein [Ralstonia solanacearum]|uniref:major capsid protein n=1 Tax=Ralstonia solanacearum TaxID=305 RepID=UPI0005C62870|nr:major capsid protein [Ralstonia solanacearum]MBB6590695.1 phage coat protein [Ralstonia solanacearum]MBB6594892.1 phage coat protein [Ralstonia solanacearum]MDB0540773.1 major capsid protein [Ralstonia solanacearum]MDB0551152.1 major capsid protein [Ralstonia solanacearum]MDB0555718.1 major capsid protein [Ralstonia solanacearum]
MKNFLKRVGLVAAVVMGAGSAMAQTATTGATVDTSAVTATLSNGLTAVGAIGVAILGLAALVALYNWVKRPIK